MNKLKSLNITISPNLVFAFLFVFFNCIYPTWYIPASSQLKLLILNAYLLTGIGFLMYFGKFPDMEFKMHLQKINFKTTGNAVFLIVALLHLPFWLLIVPTGDDFQSHIGPSAYFMSKIIPCNYMIILRTLGWIAIILILLYLMRKDRINLSLSIKNKIILFVLYAILIAGINIYGILLIKTRLIERIGLWQTIFRYPPLSKFIYLAGYYLFGIHEFIPRVIQYIFHFLTAVFMVKIIDSKNEWFNGFVYLFILLFPVFFHYSNGSMLPSGVLFFYTATSFFVLKGFETNDKQNYMLFLIFLFLGLMYKRLQAVQILILPFILLFGRKHIKDSLNVLILLFWAGLFALPFYIIGIFTGTGSSHSIPLNMLAFSDFTKHIVRLTSSNGILTTIPLILGMLYWFVKKPKNIKVIYFITLGILYYLWISTKSIWGVRQAFPVYLSLSFLFLSAMDIELPKLDAILRNVIIFAILTNFLYFNTAKKNPFVLRNFSNLYHDLYPYDQLMKYFSKIKTDNKIKVYAPMITEPSHFYEAKYGLSKKILWDRSEPENLDEKSINEYFVNNKFDYLVLVPFLQFEPLPELIMNSQNFIFENILEYRNNEIFIFKHKHRG